MRPSSPHSDTKHDEYDENGNYVPELERRASKQRRERIQGPEQGCKRGAGRQYGCRIWRKHSAAASMEDKYA
jgi:hypothetical protein